MRNRKQVARRKKLASSCCLSLASCSWLFTESEFVDDFLVAFAIGVGEVFQQAVALADHLEKAAARREVLLVTLEMLGKFRDPLGEQGDLDFRRAGVFLVGAVGL